MTSNNNQTETPKPVAKEDEVYGMPKSQFEKLSLRRQKDLEMQDIKSDLRNQVDTQNLVDFQLLSNTPAQLIVAMTNWSLEQLGNRAKELDTTLKGHQAGTMSE